MDRKPMNDQPYGDRYRMEFEGLDGYPLDPKASGSASSPNPQPGVPQYQVRYVPVPYPVMAQSQMVFPYSGFPMAQPVIPQSDSVMAQQFEQFERQRLMAELANQPQLQQRMATYFQNIDNAYYNGMMKKFG